MQAGKCTPPLRRQLKFVLNKSNALSAEGAPAREHKRVCVVKAHSKKNQRVYLVLNIV